MPDTPIALDQRINKIADELESAWANGKSITIEELLAGNNDVAADLLVPVLLPAEMEQRLRCEHRISVAEYLARFPEYAVAVYDAVREMQSYGFVVCLESQPDSSDFAETSLASPDATPGGVDDRSIFLEYRPDIGPRNDFQITGPYQVIGELGRGGMGSVYRAVNLTTNTEVALKVIKPGQHSSCASRFQREADVTARLNHPHIVPLVDSGNDQGCRYLALKLIEGATLKAQLDQQTLDCRTAAARARDLADALQHAHDNGVLHRDLKPGNILVDKAGHFWITDFGLAFDQKGEADLTEVGEQLGTVQYMAPEQALGKVHDIDHRSDVYALGATLYSMLTGEAVFHAPSRRGIYEKVIHEEPPGEETLKVSVDRDLFTIFLKCVQKSPDLRYKSAGELRDDLNRYLQNDRIHARRPALIRRWFRRCRRNPWRTASVMLMAMVISLLWFALITTEQRRVAAVESRAQEIRARRDAETAQREAEVARARTAAVARDAQDSELFFKEQQLKSWQNQHASAKRGQINQRFISYDGEATKELHSLDTVWLTDPSQSLQSIDGRYLHAEWTLADASLSPDQRLLVATHQCGTVTLTSASTGELIRMLRVSLWDEKDRPPKNVAKWTSQQQAFISSVAWLNNQTVLAATPGGQLWRIPVDQNQAPEIVTEIGEPILFVRCNLISDRVLLTTAAGESLVMPLKQVTTQNPSAETENRIQPIARHDGTSPVTAVTCLETSGLWILGRADGTLDCLDAELKPVAQLAMMASIADLYADHQTTGDRFFVCCDQRPVQMVQVSVKEKAATVIMDFDLQGREPDRHFVAVAASAQYVCAQDSQGYCLLWNRKSGELVQERGYSTPIRRNSDNQKVPEWLRQHSCRNLALPDGRWLLFDSSGLATFISHRDPQESAWNQLTVTLGRDSQLAAIPNAFGLFWSLGKDGQLVVFDAIADRIVAAIPHAHLGGAAEVVCLANGDAITVGGDTSLKTWRLVNAKIEAIHSLQHDHNLLSVAVHEATGQLAAMDETSHLTTWSLQSGTQRKTRLIGQVGELPVLTGRVAFNGDGRLLAAFGAGQYQAVVETRTLKDIPISGMRPVAKGGMAVQFSPSETDLCLVTFENACGVVIPDQSHRRHTTERWEELRMPNVTVVDMLTTPDRRRIVALERTGTLRFLTADHLVPCSDFLVPSQDCVSVAIDGTQQCAVVADSSGHMFRKTMVGAQPNVHTDRVAQVRPHMVPAAISGRVVRETPIVSFSVAGAAALPVLVANSSKAHGGDLYILRRNTDSWQWKQVSTLTPSAGVSVHQPGVAFTNDERLIVAYREVVGNLEDYGANLMLACEQPDGSWQHEVVGETENAGHYCQIVTSDDDRVSDIFHFNFDGYFLCHSRRVADTESAWETTSIRHGFGVPIKGLQRKDGIFFLSGGRKRFVSDHAGPAVLQVNPDQTVQLATPDQRGAEIRVENWLRYLNGPNVCEFQLGHIQTITSLPQDWPPSEVRLISTATDKQIAVYLNHQTTGRMFVAIRHDERWQTTELQGMDFRACQIRQIWIEGTGQVCMLVSNGGRLQVLEADLLSTTAGHQDDTQHAGFNSFQHNPVRVRSEAE